MTVVVGYLSGRPGLSALNLGVEAARTLKTSLSVVTVVPKPWTTPSPAARRRRVRAVRRQAGRRLGRAGQAVRRVAGRRLSRSASTSTPHRSAPGGLLHAVADLKAEALVLGSASDGSLGQVVVGSTADRLLHSSPVPLAICPRGYRGSKSHGLTRITAAYPGTDDSLHVVERCAALAAQLRDSDAGHHLRGARVARCIRRRSGCDAETSILQSWALASREALAALKSNGIVGDDVELQVVTGNGWDQALDAAGLGRR